MMMTGNYHVYGPELVATNPVLLAGQPVIEATTGEMKIGDGVTPWAMLPYRSGSTSGSTTDAS